MANQPVEHEKLVAFIAGTLDPEEAQAITERMGHDEDLRRQVAALIEDRSTSVPPPFPGLETNMASAAHPEPPPAPSGETPQKPWQRLLSSLKGQTKQQSRLAAFAIGCLVAAAVSGLVFLLYLDKEIKPPQPAKIAHRDSAEPPPAPPAEGPAAAEAPAAPVGETAPPASAPATNAPTENVNVNAAAAPAEIKEADATAAPENHDQPPAAAAPAPEPEPAVGEEPKAAAPTAPAKFTVPAGSRFAVLAKACAVHEDPQEDSKSVNQLTEGQRLWTEPAVEGWKKVYRKKGVAYMQEDCFAPSTAKALAAVKTEKPAKTKEKKDDPLRDEASELSDAPAPQSPVDTEPLESPAPKSAKKGKYYMTLLSRSETKLEGAADPANVLGYLAEHLDGNTDCLPMSIPSEKLGDGLTLNVQVKADGSILSVGLNPKLPGGKKIAACFKSLILADQTALAGKDGRWAIVLRPQ